MRRAWEHRYRSIHVMAGENHITAEHADVSASRGREEGGTEGQIEVVYHRHDPVLEVARLQCREQCRQSIDERRGAVRSALCEVETSCKPMRCGVIASISVANAAARSGKSVLAISPNAADAACATALGEARVLQGSKHGAEIGANVEIARIDLYPTEPEMLGRHRCAPRTAHRSIKTASRGIVYSSARARRVGSLVTDCTGPRDAQPRQHLPSPVGSSVRRRRAVHACLGWAALYRQLQVCQYWLACNNSLLLETLHS